MYITIDAAKMDEFVFYITGYDATNKTFTFSEDYTKFFEWTDILLIRIVSLNYLRFTHHISDVNSTDVSNVIINPNTNISILNNGKMFGAIHNNEAPSLAITDANTTITYNISVDATEPELSNVTFTAGTYKFNDDIEVTLNFTEAVNVDTSNGTPYLQLNIGGVIVDAFYVVGGGTTDLLFIYSIDGTDTLDTTTNIEINNTNSLILNSATIKDANGNDATITIPSDKLVLTGVNVSNEPAVTNITSSSGDYGENSNVDISVTFHTNAVVDTTNGTPSLELEIGPYNSVNVLKDAVYNSGSGTTTLIFRYTVDQNISDRDGITIKKLKLNSGVIKNNSNDEMVNDVTLNESLVNVKIKDITTPTVKYFNFNNNTLTTENPVNVIIQYSESVYNFNQTLLSEEFSKQIVNAKTGITWTASGNYTTSGLYYYGSSHFNYANNAYFGQGGTIETQNSPSSGDKLRFFGGEEIKITNANNANTEAFGTLESIWTNVPDYLLIQEHFENITPGETVNIYLNRSLITSFTASSNALISQAGTSVDDSTGYGYGGAGPKIINGNVYIKAANLTELNAFNVSNYANWAGSGSTYIWNTDTITYGWLNISANNLNVSNSTVTTNKTWSRLFTPHTDIDTTATVSMTTTNIFDMSGNQLASSNLPSDISLSINTMIPPRIEDIEIKAFDSSQNLELSNMSDISTYSTMRVRVRFNELIKLYDSNDVELNYIEANDMAIEMR